jgi:FtsP/CotA-like multicopper oxidase with cupredoxin domain
MRKGVWHPEQEDGEGIAAYAFGEAGKPLQVPGPAIRVAVGTTIHVTLHNRLTVPATLHGLHRRPGNSEDVLVVDPGASTEILLGAYAGRKTR